MRRTVHVIAGLLIIGVVRLYGLADVRARLLDAVHWTAETIGVEQGERLVRERIAPAVRQAAGASREGAVRVTDDAMTTAGEVSESGPVSLWARGRRAFGRFLVSLRDLVGRPSASDAVP